MTRGDSKDRKRTPRLLTDHRYSAAFLNAEATMALRELEGSEVPLDVLRWACRECARQKSGEISVGWMIDAWLYALGHRKEPVDLRHVLLLGRLVEPRENGSGVRWGPVSVGREGKMPAAEVPRALDELVEAQDRMDPDRWYVEYEEVHPFWDGNGRTGTLLWLWLKGSLERPEHPPDFHDPEGFWARVKEHGRRFGEGAR